MLSLVRLALVALLFSATSLTLAQDRRGPFTQPPKSVRTREVDQLHVKLALVFDWAKPEFTGQATHRVRTFGKLNQLTLDAAEMQVTAVKLHNGEQASELKHQQRGQELLITLDREYPAESELLFTIDYRVTKPQHGAHFVIPDAS